MQLLAHASRGLPNPSIKTHMAGMGHAPNIIFVSAPPLPRLLGCWDGPVGYSFTHRMSAKDWAAHRRHLARVMSFDAVPLGKHLGMHVTSPFTQPGVVRAALTCGKADCVQPQVRAGCSVGLRVL